MMRAEAMGMLDRLRRRWRGELAKRAALAAGCAVRPLGEVVAGP